MARYIGRYGETIEGEVIDSNDGKLLVQGLGLNRKGKKVPVFFEVDKKTGKKNGFYESHTPEEGMLPLYDVLVERMDYKDDLLDGVERHFYTLMKQHPGAYILASYLEIFHKEWSKGKEKKGKVTSTRGLLDILEKSKELDKASEGLRKKRESLLQNATTGIQDKKKVLEVLRRINVQDIRDEEGKARAKKLKELFKNKQSQK